MKSQLRMTIVAACLLAAGASQAEILLHTNFQGRSLDGPARTASGFSWTSELGQAGNASTSLVFTGSATGFIGGYNLTSGTLNPPGQPIPVAGNIENVGPWSTSFTFTPDIDVELTTIRMISYAISNTGSHQFGVAKSVQWAVNVSGGTVNTTSTNSGNDPSGTAPLTLDLDFGGVQLQAGTTYTFSLTVSSPAPTGGNNIALNSIQVNAIPQPGDTLTWVGAPGGGTWDIGTTAHWMDAASNPSVFRVNDLAIFDDTAATGLVDLAEPGIWAYSVTFENDTLPYVLSGEAWTGTGSLVKNGAGEATLLFENNLASTAINAGTLRIGDGGMDGSPGTGPVANDGALVIHRDGTVMLGALSGAGTLEIQGPGTTVLAGATHTGVTTVGGGTLRAAGILDSPVTVQSGGTLAPGAVAASGTLELPALTLESGSATNFRTGFSGGDEIKATGIDGLAINGPHSIHLIPTEPWLAFDEFPLFLYDTSFSGSVANLQIGSAPHGSYTILDDNLFGEIYVRVDSLDTLVWKGNVDSNWDVDDTANWQLLSDNSAANFFAYDQVRFDGTAANTTVTATDEIAVAGMVFDFNSPTSYLLDGPGTITGFGNLDKDGTGTLTIATTMANTGTITVAGGTLVVGDGGADGRLGGGAITNNGALVFNRDGNHTVANGIGGSGTLTQQGLGTLTLGVPGTANTFTGDVTVASGRLTLGKATALGISENGAKIVTVADGASLNFNNYTNAASPERSYTFRIEGDGDGSGALVNNSGTGIIANTGVFNLELTGDAAIGGTVRFDIGIANGVSGTITGNGHTLTKTGTNQIMMRGDAGGSDISIVVEQGVLGAEDHNNCLGGTGGSVTVRDGAVLGVWGALNIPTPVTLNDGSTLRALGSADATWSGDMTLNGAATVATPAVGKIITGTISGNGGLTKIGDNVLTLAADNTYTGPTTVSAGTLVIQQPYLAETSAVTITASGILSLDFSGINTIGNLTIAGESLPPGIYDATTHPGHLAGTGQIEVTVATGDYDDWAASFSLVGGPNDDDDGDGLSNFQEYAFGTDPTNPADVSPVTAPDMAAGTFTYTRRTLSLTGLNYTYLSSTDLADWDPFTPVSAISDNGDPVETIIVTIPAVLLAEPRLFLQVEANGP